MFDALNERIRQPDADWFGAFQAPAEMAVAGWMKPTSVSGDMLVMAGKDSPWQGE